MEKIIKILGSRSVLVNRREEIMFQRYVNQLRHNIEVSNEWIEKVDEMRQRDK